MKALAVDPNYVNALNNKGNALRSLSKYAEAIQYFDRALAVDPNDKYALTGKGNGLYGLGKYTEAIQYYDRALAVDPKYVNALTNKGLALGSLGKYTEAIQYFDKALAIKPADVDILNNKGNALGKLGKYTEATKYYQKAIEILKSNHSNQSTSYSQTALGVTGAATAAAYRYNTVADQDFLNIQYVQITDTQNTSTQDPKLVILQINYAKNLVNIGKYQLAITTYNVILQSDPYNGCALFGKAQALDKSGQHGEAVKNYEIAKKLSPACSNDPINLQKKVDQPSQIGALAQGFSLLISHR